LGGVEAPAAGSAGSDDGAGWTSSPVAGGGVAVDDRDAAAPTVSAAGSVAVNDGSPLFQVRQPAAAAGGYHSAAAADLVGAPSAEISAPVDGDAATDLGVSDGHAAPGSSLSGPGAGGGAAAATMFSSAVLGGSIVHEIPAIAGPVSAWTLATLP